MEHGAWSMACDVIMEHGLCLYLCGCPDARTCPVSRYPAGYVQICLDMLVKPLETTVQAMPMGMQYCIAYVQYCLLGCMCNTIVCAILGYPLYACPQYYVGASIQMYPGIHATPGFVSDQSTRGAPRAGEVRVLRVGL